MASTLDHIALIVDDLEEAAAWYAEHCGGIVTHKQDTYYRLHLEDLPKEKGLYVQHRDGTHGVYVTDPWGNHLEYICYNTEECKEKFLSYRGSS